MFKSTTRTALIVLATSLALGGASAQAASFAKYDGVDGESSAADQNHDKWIDVLNNDLPQKGATGSQRQRGATTMGDIDASTSERSKGGNAETTWKVEKGEK